MEQPNDRYNKYVDTIQDPISLPPFNISTQPLLSWDEVIKPLIGEIEDIETYAWSSKDFAEQKSPWVNGITNDEAAAINLYTVQWTPNWDKSLYIILNKTLRDTRRTGISKFYPYLRLLYEGIGKLKPTTNKNLYRGIINNRQYEKDEKIRFWGFSSTSVILSVVTIFIKEEEKSVIFSMTCNCGYDISNFSFFPNEKEVLVIPPVQFKVTGVGKYGKLSIVDLEQDYSFPIKYYNINNNNVQSNTISSNVTEKKKKEIVLYDEKRKLWISLKENKVLLSFVDPKEKNEWYVVGENPKGFWDEDGTYKIYDNEDKLKGYFKHIEKDIWHEIHNDGDRMIFKEYNF